MSLFVKTFNIFILGNTGRRDMFSVHQADKLVYFGDLIAGYGLFSRTIEYSESRRWMGPLRYVYASKYGLQNLKLKTSSLISDTILSSSDT